jgi:hypothetical protein
MLDRQTDRISYCPATNLYDWLVMFIQRERTSAPRRIVALKFFQSEFFRKNKKTKIMITAIMIIRIGLIAKFTINTFHQQSSIIRITADPKASSRNETLRVSVACALRLRREEAFGSDLSDSLSSSL